MSFIPMEIPQMNDNEVGCEDYDHDVWEQVDRVYRGDRRWGTDMEYVLKHKETESFWSFTVYEPATESQDWFYEPVTGVRVYPTPVVTMEYRPAA